MSAELLHIVQGSLTGLSKPFPLLCLATHTVSPNTDLHLQIGSDMHMSCLTHSCINAQRLIYWFLMVIRGLHSKKFTFQYLDTESVQI